LLGQLGDLPRQVVHLGAKLSVLRAEMGVLDAKFGVLLLKVCDPPAGGQVRRR